MVWKNDDNKKYRGKIDKVYVSLLKTWEVETYIDHYLVTRNYDLTDDNRSIIAYKLEAAPGKPPHTRDGLNAWLDEQYPKR